MHPQSQINVAILCPDNFRVACGTDVPSASLFDFESNVPTKNFFGVNTEITTMKFHQRGSSHVLLGTYGGTIINWDANENRGKPSAPFLSV